MGSFHQCFCWRVLSLFLKLPNSFPSHFHASVFVVHFPESSYTVLLKSKTQNTFWNNYVTSHWPLNNVQTTKPGLQGYGHLPQLPSFVGFSPGCRCFQVPSVSEETPCVFCTCCSLAGRNHYHEWSIINTCLASVTNQLSQEGSCKTTSLQQIHSNKTGVKMHASHKLPRICFEEDFKKWIKCLWSCHSTHFYVDILSKKQANFVA